ncbi:hypothetical protein GOV08_04895 [Candidatus Woesearchaeota archaeon]|nr:hypothetical protein [Candidatus Woesearchaeota archaeon]
MEKTTPPTSQKRSVAVKIRISDILKGEYVIEEGWAPNYVKTSKGKVSRVNIIGVVISREENLGFDSLIIDDSTGNISIRSFEDNKIITPYKIGDLVILIGKPRKYGEEIYIIPEIIKPLKEKKWAQVRIKEIGLKKDDIKEEPVSEKIVVKTNEEPLKKPSENSFEIILKTIKELDEGFGVSYELVDNKSNVKNFDEIIKNLIEEGEIFEIRPGILKIL